MSKDSSEIADDKSQNQSDLNNIPGSKIPLVPWNPWLAVAYIAVVYYMSQIFSGVIVSIYPYLKHWDNARANDWLQNSVSVQFIYVLIAELFTLGAIYLFLKKYKVTFRIIGLLKPRWKDIGYGIIAAPIYYVIYLLTVGVVSHFVPSLNINQHQEIGFNSVHGAAALIITFISLVILPPLTEEIMVRGFLYSSLRKATPKIAAVILTSLIFASAHLPEGGAAGPLYIAALDTFVLSLVLIYLREKTGSLWASITLHGIKNGIAFIALFVINVH